MTHKISQEAIAFVNSEKAKWLELQLLNAVNQVLIAQEKIKELENLIEELKKEKNGSTT